MEQYIVDNFLEKVQDLKTIKELIEKLSSYKSNSIYANDITRLLSNIKNIRREEHPELGITSFNYNSREGVYTIAVSTDFDIVIYINYLSAYIEEILSAIANFFGNLIKEMNINDKETIDRFNRMFKDALSKLLDLYLNNFYIELTLDERKRVVYIHAYGDVSRDPIQEIYDILSTILSMLIIVERFLIIKV